MSHPNSKFKPKYNNSNPNSKSKPKYNNSKILLPNIILNIKLPKYQIIKKFNLFHNLIFDILYPTLLLLLP